MNLKLLVKKHGHVSCIVRMAFFFFSFRVFHQRYITISPGVFFFLESFLLAHLAMKTPSSSPECTNFYQRNFEKLSFPLFLFQHGCL